MTNKSNPNPTIMTSMTEP